MAKKIFERIKYFFIENIFPPILHPPPPNCTSQDSCATRHSLLPRHAPATNLIKYVIYFFLYFNDFRGGTVALPCGY
jgi:hypothetical protein